MPLSVQVMKRSFLTRIIVVPCCLLLLFATFTPVAMADVKAQTTIEHNPPGYFVPEYRIQMDARVKDPSGVELVRCYFRAAGEADFVFVPMTPTGGNSYSGILPAPSSATKQIEYLFLSVNEENVIVKTQAYVINGEERDEAPSWQDIAQDDEIRVSMELDEVPSELPGFSDNIVMDQVESGLRFGVVAGGLYQLTASKTAGTSGLAASASSAGAVTAGTGGLSTAAIIGIGAAGAATAVAVADSGSSGSSSSGSSNDDDLPGRSGEVRVSLQWNDCNDLDLHVIDPCGNRIYYANRSATCNGRTGNLDLDANADDCMPSPAENIYWESAPRGRYTVEVDYYWGYGSSSYTVTTVVGGQRQTFNGSISGGTRTITSFTY